MSQASHIASNFAFFRFSIIWLFCMNSTEFYIFFPVSLYASFEGLKQHSKSSKSSEKFLYRFYWSIGTLWNSLEMCKFLDSWRFAVWSQRKFIQLNVWLLRHDVNCWTFLNSLIHQLWYCHNGDDTLKLFVCSAAFWHLNFDLGISNVFPLFIRVDWVWCVYLLKALWRFMESWFCH